MSFNRPSARKDRSADRQDTPRVWSEGRQKPRFDLRGFARVSLILSRQMARPLLTESARIFGGGAGWMGENTLGPRLARASLLGRALPARARVARGLDAAAGFLMTAADIAVPPPLGALPPELPEFDPAQITRRPRQADRRLAELAAKPPQADPAPAPVTAPPVDKADRTDTAIGTAELDEPTVAAIRAMIKETRNITPTRPKPSARRAVAVPVVPDPPTGRVLLTRGIPLNPPEPHPPTMAERVSTRTVFVAAGVVAGAVTLLTLPVGMVRAGLKHLIGHDLRT